MRGPAPVAFRTAEELLITQPALSGTIAQSEGNLSVRLLDRSSRQVEPTETGAEFLVRVERVLAPWIRPSPSRVTKYRSGSASAGCCRTPGRSRPSAASRRARERRSR
ncbi:LysR family transcriptional regulator [Streptomyces massasporeus]|uniref:LysR family transcriptional regulator n=1 Tax=Streptomyces massasporeus TaxID=67324 RepID=UPI0033EE3392